MASQNAPLSRESAGLLLYRHRDQHLEVLLVHPGGPLWRRRDEGAWSIPKGEIEQGETPIDVARREFREEIGRSAPDGDLTSLGWVRQSGGKVVHAWAMHADIEADLTASSRFEMEWPPRSGRKELFPEVDRAEWFDVETARRKINPAQQTFLDRVEELARPSGS